VEVSKRVKNILRVEKKYEKLKERECFVVWNFDHSIIKQILEYYNKVNHFQNYTPTWLTNIISP